MDPPIIPRFNTHERLLEIESARKPSKATLRDLHCEIRLAGGREDRVFSPGEIVQGEFVMFSTKQNKVINDIYFNAIEIKFQNVFHTAVNTNAAFFSMDNSPTLDDLPAFAINPNKHSFESCSFPFSFTIPHEHLEDTCVSQNPMHRALLPTYGSPQLCGESFHPTEVAGLRATKSLAMDKIKDLSFTKFSNFYSVSCKIMQHIRGLDKPYVVFARSLEIKVQNRFNPLPTNIGQTDMDIGTYYNVGDVNSSNDLSITKSIGLRKLNDDPTGSITVSALLPSPVAEGSKTSFPIDLKYTPNAKDQLLPTVTAIIELGQYTLQSSVCVPPQTSFSQLPGDIADFTLSSKSGKTTLIQKIQTVYKEESVIVEGEWTPDYNDVNSYVNHSHITIPELEKDEVLTSTFHSCHLQNFYCLNVKIMFDQKDDQLEENPKKTSRQSSLGSVFGMKRTASQDSNVSEKYITGRNTVGLTIPVLIL